MGSGHPHGALVSPAKAVRSITAFSCSLVAVSVTAKHMFYILIERRAGNRRAEQDGPGWHIGFCSAGAHVRQAIYFLEAASIKAEHSTNFQTCGDGHDRRMAIDESEARDTSAGG